MRTIVCICCMERSTPLRLGLEDTVDLQRRVPDHFGRLCAGTGGLSAPARRHPAASSRARRTRRLFAATTAHHAAPQHRGCGQSCGVALDGGGRWVARAAHREQRRVGRHGGGRPVEGCRHQTSVTQNRTIATHHIARGNTMAIAHGRVTGQLVWPESEVIGATHQGLQSTFAGLCAWTSCTRQKPWEHTSIGRPRSG